MLYLRPAIEDDYVISGVISTLITDLFIDALHGTPTEREDAIRSMMVLLHSLNSSLPSADSEARLHALRSLASRHQKEVAA